MNKILILVSAIILCVGLVPFRASSDVPRGGVRVPAASCATYSNTPAASIISSSGGLAIFNPAGRTDVTCVCSLPVPENSRIIRFVMVGNVEKGRITAELGGVRPTAPRQHIRFAALAMLSTTPDETGIDMQKKIATDLPLSGPQSLLVDRSQMYFIQANLKSDSPINLEEALELFYFEIYWN